MISWKSLRKRLSFAHVFCEGEARGGVEPRRHHIVTPEESEKPRSVRGFFVGCSRRGVSAYAERLRYPLPIRQSSRSQAGRYHFFRMLY